MWVAICGEFMENAESNYVERSGNYFCEPPIREAKEVKDSGISYTVYSRTYSHTRGRTFTNISRVNDHSAVLSRVNDHSAVLSRVNDHSAVLFRVNDHSAVLPAHALL